jgi:hypothetical protein
MGEVSNIAVRTIATDANVTLAVSDLSGGAVQFTGFTASRNITTPTAAQILASAPDMDIGDSFTVTVSTSNTFGGTYVAGTGVTLLGRATLLANSSSYIIVTRTGAAAVSWNVL